MSGGILRELCNFEAFGYFLGRIHETNVYSTCAYMIDDFRRSCFHDHHVHSRLSAEKVRQDFAYDYLRRTVYRCYPQFTWRGLSRNLQLTNCRIYKFVGGLRRAPESVALFREFDSAPVSSKHWVANYRFNFPKLFAQGRLSHAESYRGI
ncbi:hypothetical protein BTHE68_40790 [Burkholderia sp. THE68]|nr:hypothetical protein BTHE68_40790 [Burkholderia sp. THE68]